jgi:putative hydrolase of the HAD superfamily
VVEDPDSYQTAMRSQSSKQLVVWDLDNTLFDRDSAFLRCLQELSASHGKPFTADGLRRIMEFDQSGRADRLSTMEVVARELGKPASDAVALWTVVQESLPRHVEPDPAAFRILNKLFRSHRFALVSNGGTALQRGKLERTGVAHFFEPELIIISGEVGATKPDPAIFLELARRSGSPLETALFVGDDPVNDIAGASASNMQTCWISRGRAVPSFISPDHVFRDLDEMHTLYCEASLT